MLQYILFLLKVNIRWKFSVYIFSEVCDITFSSNAIEMHFLHSTSVCTGVALAVAVLGWRPSSDQIFLDFRQDF